MQTDRPENLFEQASYDLKQFRERRIADRRLQPRGTADRRVRNIWPPESSPDQPPAANDGSRAD
jgi:hypothetical protein